MYANVYLLPALHFRHLVGDQEVVFSEDKIEVLRKPVNHTKMEILCNAI